MEVKTNNQSKPQQNLPVTMEQIVKIIAVVNPKVFVIFSIFDHGKLVIQQSDCQNIKQKISDTKAETIT